MKRSTDFDADRLYESLKNESGGDELSLDEETGDDDDEDEDDD